MPTSRVYRHFDQATLDREYSPSSRVDDINVYLEAYARESAAAKSAAVAAGACRPDLRYGPGAAETLDLFLPDTDDTDDTVDPAPIHVYIHGGYWQLLSKDDSSFAAPLFRERGSCFAAVNYTLAPAQTLTGIVDENRRAIAWLYEHAEEFGFDRSRIYLSGSSAGAHLCMMMLSTDWTGYGLPRDAVKGVCAVSGVYDLEPVRLSYVNDKVGMDPAEARANSPIHRPLVNRCPVILAVGDNETDEFKRQTGEFRAFLEAGGVPVTFREIEGRNHFDVIMDLGDPDSWLAQRTLELMRV